MCGEAIASLMAGGVVVGGGLVALLLMSAHNHPDRKLPALRQFEDGGQPYGGGNGGRS